MPLQTDAQLRRALKRQLRKGVLKFASAGGAKGSLATIERVHLGDGGGEQGPKGRGGGFSCTRIPDSAERRWFLRARGKTWVRLRRRPVTRGRSECYNFAQAVSERGEESAGGGGEVPELHMTYVRASNTVYLYAAVSWGERYASPSPKDVTALFPRHERAIRTTWGGDGLPGSVLTAEVS